MKILIYSDLHLEFKPFATPACSPDVVILAGDIATKTRGVQWADESFSCPVLYVLGNHEQYDGHLDRTVARMKAIQVTYVRILENQSYVFGDVRFLGTTGWTDFSITGDGVAATHTALQRMNDFKYIRAGDSDRLMTPEDVINRNQVARAWLKNELEKPFAGKTVVITHHALVAQVLGDKHEGHLTSAYANQWDELITNADLWGFGHTHRLVDMKLGKCRVVSNPRGYPTEPTGFDPAFMVEI